MKRWIALILVFFLTVGLLGCAQKETAETKVTTTAKTPTPTPTQVQVTPGVTPTVDINSTIEEIENLINELNEIENINFNLE